MTMKSSDDDESSEMSACRWLIDILLVSFAGGARVGISGVRTLDNPW
jgi:hypothetical protein